MNKIEFSFKNNSKDTTTFLTLANSYSTARAFKIKSNNPQAYAVNPN